MSKKLFEESGESDNELKLNTNRDYAKSYNFHRKRELLQKYKDRGYNVSESESSSDSDSSDNEELDVNFDKEFFKTLSSLKSKDPAIYDKKTRFFNEENIQDAAKDDKTLGIPKSVTLKEYERKIILEKGGKFDDDSDVEGNDDKIRASSPSRVEEERRLKAEFKKVVNASDSEGEEEFGGIFKKRQKSKEENDEEQADYLKWLAGKKEETSKEFQKDLQPLKNYWNSEKLPQSERFLRDYILNKGYSNTNPNEIPTYDEIVGDNVALSEDEQELEKQAEFEEKYNFRYEEPDAEFVRRYPRTIDNSVRQVDSKRKEKRQAVKQRKLIEKEQKMKELEMIKEMKRNEIEEKIRKLKAVTGNDEIGFKDDELEDDFDPAAHDRRMKELFDDQYYQDIEGEEKPECPSDIEELKVENWDNYNPNQVDNADDYGYDDYEPHCEDEDFNMDCDYDASTSKETLQKELIENTKGKRKRRGRRNRFMEIIQAEKPPFNPEDEKTYADYIDEYYKMDCEDIIGDVPCRFKYVETTPNDFGLTVEEILLAKNKELNQWVSLKKMIQHRPENVEKRDQRMYKLKAKNEDLKRKIFKSLYAEEGSDSEDERKIFTQDNNKEQQPDKSSNNTLKQSNVNETQATENTIKIDQQSDATLENSKTLLDTTENTSVVTKSKNKKKKKNKKTKKEDEAENPASETVLEKISENGKQNQNKSEVADTKPSTQKTTEKPIKSKLVANNNKVKKKKLKSKKLNAESLVEDERLKAYGLNPRKFHKKQNYAKTQN